MTWQVSPSERMQHARWPVVQKGIKALIANGVNVSDCLLVKKRALDAIGLHRIAWFKQD